jgi:dipeptidyl aminopeptidase/acylaminoacyl peptidase
MLRQFWCVLAVAGAMMISVPAAEADGDKGAAPPSAADLAAPAAYGEPQISPDGRRIAALATDDGRARILITDLADPARAVRTLSLGDSEQLAWLRWAGSGRLLLSLASERQPPRLVALDLASGTRTPLGASEAGARGDNVIHLDRAGTFLLLSGGTERQAFPAVYRIDLASGAATRLVAPQTGVREWYADSAGVVRAGLGSSGDRRWLLYRAGEGEAFTETSGRTLDLDGDVDQLVPVAGSDQGYAIAGAPGGRYALFRYDFAADRLGTIVYEHPRVDLDGFQTSPEGSLLGVVYTEDREETRWFDSRLADAQARIDAALPDSVNRIVSMSDDRRRLLVWSGGATNPGRFHLFDEASGAIETLADPYPSLRGRRLAAMAAIRYRARDGLEIRGYLTLPAGRTATGLPLVVVPHGGPFVRDSWSYDPWVQYLAAQGYAVLQPNYRGSTGFGRDFVEAGDGEWGRGMQDDVDDGVEWLAAQGMIDRGRVCIMGASYGGYAAMWAAVQQPARYRCAISFAGISDVDGQLRYDRGTFASARQFRSWRHRIQGDASSLAALSPLKFVDRMTVPILIAHGTADETVPLFQSQRLHEALVRRKRPHEYVAYPGEDHGLADPDNNADFLGRVGAFLAKHNPS